MYEKSSASKNHVYVVHHFLSRKIPGVLWCCIFCNGGTKCWQPQGSSLSLHRLFWERSTCDCHHGGWPFLLPGQGAPAGDDQWKLIVFEMMHLPDGWGLWLVCCSLWPQRGWLGWLGCGLSSLQVVFGNTGLSILIVSLIQQPKRRGNVQHRPCPLFPFWERRQTVERLVRCKYTGGHAIWGFAEWSAFRLLGEIGDSIL